MTVSTYAPPPVLCATLTAQYNNILHLDTLNGSRDMTNLRPALITSPSSKRSLSINKQKIAQVGECHTPQNTSVRGEQSPLSPKAADRPETDNNLTIYTQNVHGLRAKKEKLDT